MLTATAAIDAPRLRWTWLWSRSSDLVWNLIPFWLGFGLIAGLVMARGSVGGADALGVLRFAGRQVGVATVLLYLYGPLIDAPHLWATIARTYADRDEWATRRRLFIGSLALFLVGPALILLPYALRSLGLFPAGREPLGFLVWSHFLAFYALFHINRQHWGFVALYRRKNGEGELERQVDYWFFHAAIWIPYAAFLVAPWYVDHDGKPFALVATPIGSTTLGAILLMSLRALFVAVCAGYALFQLDRYRRGAPRNGPKLVYLATVVSLYFATFTVHPAIAAFWVPIVGIGHCAQYHRVVWAYGQSRYAPKQASAKSLPSKIFGNVWLYAVLGLAFGLLTLQGPGAGAASQLFARALNAGLFQHAFGFLGATAGLALGIKVVAALLSGVRIHHFFVDSKIWRVSKSASLAKNLNV